MKARFSRPLSLPSAPSFGPPSSSPAKQQDHATVVVPSTPGSPLPFPPLLDSPSIPTAASSLPLSLPRRFSMDPSSSSAASPAPTPPPEGFIAPEGLYASSATHFPPPYIPQPVSPNAAPALPVRLSFISVWCPPKKDGPGLGGLLGMGGGGGGASAGGAGSGATKEALAPAAGGYEASLSSSSDEPSGSDNAASQFGVSPLPDSSLPSTSASNPRTTFLKPSSAGQSAGQQAPHPRPKTNVRSTSSSFVTRVQSMEGLNKLLGERNKMGESVTWAFWNYGRVFGWVELGGKAKEPLARVTFSHAITCHAVQYLTSGHDRLDVFIGFASGDIVWFDPITGRYSRLNKLGVIHPSPVLHLVPHPSKPTLLYAVFQDGHIFTFSLDREDPTQGSFSPPWLVPPSPVLAPSSSTSSPSSGGSDWMRRAEMYTWRNVPPREGEKDKDKAKLSGRNPVALFKLDVGDGGLGSAASRRRKALLEREKEKEAAGGKGSGSGGTDGKGGAGGAGGSAAPGNAQVQPASHAAPTETGKGLTAAGASPDGRFLALTGDDGGLRIFDIASERLTDVYLSYFGGLTSLSWSPDSRFLLTGGQDDLITILSPRDQRVVARCQGHTSFISSLDWDRERCDPAKGRYRFGSVGEDGKVLLWDFSPASLQRPRHHSSTHNARGSVASFSHQLRRNPSSDPSNPHLPLSSSSGPQPTIYHPAPPRAEVALLQAVMTKASDPGVLTQLSFIPDAICTVSRAAQVRFWARPSRAGGLAASSSANAARPIGRTTTGSSGGMRGLGIGGRASGRAVGVQG